MLYRNIMDCLRRYVRAVERNAKQTDSKIDGLAKHKGSEYYTEQVNKIKGESEKQVKSLFENTKRDLSGYLSTMRENAKKHITKPPTQEQVATLDLLSKLDGLTIEDIALYAPIMAETPLALRRLQQIAQTAHLQVICPDPPNLLHAIDIVESNLANFLGSYRNDTEHSWSGIEKQLMTVLHLDEYSAKEVCGSLEAADRAAWDSVLLPGIHYDPEVFDGKMPAPQVKLFFGDLAGLREYIRVETEGLSPLAATEKKNEILANCPDSYGTALRYFEGSGEVLDINNPNK